MRVKVIAYCDFLRFINTMHPTIVVAIITGIASITVAFLHLLTALKENGDKKKNDSSPTTHWDGPEVIAQLHSLERRMDRVERKVGRLETEHVLQGWNGYEEVNQKMLK
ncbi:uncharacterized protein LOC131301151 isoform X1 [Rhododendron vialii]|uniref:uncharacterized protein LOC131301151 isoform X1 n=2 Tax=Rhododendron vialii TaxID=182163 RepID=UPI00265DEBCA|nr:uncharacterized protein LOC131301151 isoform X1 [Rhododendron vialii]